MNYQTIKISPKISLKSIPPRGFLLSDYQKTEIDTIWRQEQGVRSTKLFNGRMFNLIELKDEEIVGEFIEYKYYLAQLRNPSYVEVLRILPVCISGITMAGDKVLIGQRSDKVMQYPEYYETVPSGGIDDSTQTHESINLTRQFEKELWEETKISVTEIKKIELFSLIFDPDNNLYELCAQIQVNYSCLKEPIESNEEYTKFQWLNKHELKSLIQISNNFVPLSLSLLKSKFL